PSTKGQVSKGQNTQGCLGRRLHDHGAAGRQSSSNLAEDHSHWEIPWDQSNADTDWLLDHKGPSVRDGGDRYGASNAFCFSGKPPGKTQRIVDLSASLGKRLARLVGNQLG